MPADGFKPPCCFGPHQVFRSFHDTLVANPLYKRAVELSAHTLAYAQHTVPYKLGAM